MYPLSNRLGILITCTLLLPQIFILVPARGDEPASANDDLQQRVIALEQELQRVRSDLQMEAARSQTPANVEYFSGEPVVPYCECSPATAASQFPAISVGGFFHADWAWFDQEPANRLAVDDVQDGAAFRRARLSAYGDVAENVGYMIEFDFGFPGRPSFMDVYMDVRDTPLGTVRFGQWRHPIGMDGLTGVKELTFMERALPFAFLPFRQIGVGLQNHNDDKTVTWAISGFRYPSDPFGGNVGDNGGYGLASRITMLPLFDEETGSLYHLGFAYSIADPANDRVRYRTQPEVFVAETGGADLVPAGVPSTVPLFVDTGPINAANYQLFATEAAARWNSLHLQSEAMFASVSRLDGANVNFFGAYAQVGYVLTGEVRPYNFDGGVLGRITPNQNFGTQGYGAWEIAARWSHLDLNDDNIAGGRMNNVTAGLNWYLNRHAKFQFNYIHVFLNDANVGDSEADVIALRGQLDF